MHEKRFEGAISGLRSPGPPIAHRLNPKDLAGLFTKAGFRKWKMTELSDTVLYCLEV
jgi:hypothetical protein